MEDMQIVGMSSMENDLRAALAGDMFALDQRKVILLMTGLGKLIMNDRFHDDDMDAVTELSGVLLESLIGAGGKN